MKICLINNLYKPYARGGAEKIVEILACELKKAGHSPFIVSTKPKNNSLRNFEANFYYLNSAYYNLGNYAKFIRFFWHLYDTFDLINYFRLKSILKKEKPDLVITNNLEGMGMLAPLAIKSQKIKHVHVLHDIQLLHPSGLMITGKEAIIGSLSALSYQSITKAFTKSIDKVISPSRWLLDLHTDKGFFKKSKKAVLPYPFDLVGASTGKKINKTYKFLFAGQIEEHKGIIFLIKSFLDFKNKYKLNCELTVAGKGSLNESIKRMANGNKAINIVGYKEKSEMEKLYKNADCLIVPSLCYENSPTVIYEAFSFGLPVIASNIGGIGELLQNKRALFRPGDQSELMDKMRLMIEKKFETKAPKFPNYSEYINKIIK